MNKVLLVISLFSILFLQACGKSDATLDVTELEGKWQLCAPVYPGPPVVPGAIESSSSFALVFVFQGENVTITVEEHEGSNCSNLISVVDVVDYGLLVEFQSRIERFEIRNALITLQDEPAREIDFIDENGTRYLYIYVLRNNNQELYLAGSCDSNNPESVLIQCVNGRPVEISEFSAPYTKIE